MTIKYNPVEIARQFIYVREAATQNTGLRVEAIQKWCGGQAGESWCCYFVTLVLDICYQGNAPFARQGSCEAIHGLAEQNGWITKSPVAGDLFIYVNADGHAHHIGFVTTDGGGTGIAGNTSQDGTSSNGDRVAEHAITANPAKIKYIHYPR